MNAPRTVVIAGASGMIGRKLAAHLLSLGYRVRRLVRTVAATSAPPLAADDIPWNPASGRLDASLLEGCEAIVNLAGEPIAQRWSASKQRVIRDSRLAATSTLVRAVREMKCKPRVMLSGSAIGFYGPRGEEIVDERDAAGTGFLASVAKEWEQTARTVEDCGVRLVLLRTGVVLSPTGGALAMMLLPFRLGVGGPSGSGEQWMSWISLHDQVRAMAFAIESGTVRGPVNVVAPNAVRNREFAHTLGTVLHRPTVIPTPAFALELMFGQMARETILEGQHASPRVLEEAGFQFELPSLERALEREITEARDRAP